MKVLASFPRFFITLPTAAMLIAPGHVQSADLLCAGLVPPGQKIICAGFEPNWAIELACEGPGDMLGNFIDAFSGGTIQQTTGTVTVLSQNPWQFETSHPVTGSIAFTPGGCTDEGDNVHDFTFTPTGAPGLSLPFFPFCCRME